MAKKKISKKTISLICSFAFLVVLSVILVLFIQTEEKKEELSSTDETIILYDKQITEIEKINVDRENDNFDIVLKPNTDATYYIEKLDKFQRQENKYTSATKAIANLSSQKLIAESTDNITQYGLDNPQTKIKFKFKNEDERTLLIGNISPDDKGAYMKFADDDKIYLSSAIIRNTYTYGSESFISTTVVEARGDNQPTVTLVEFGGTSRNEKIVLKHTPTNDNSPVGATEYTITQPVECYINTDYTATVFNNFFGIFASSIVAYNPTNEVLTNYGLDKPFSTLRVVYDDNEYQLNLGNQTEDFYYATITGRDVIYQIAKESIAWADSTFEKLHAQMLFTPAISDVKQLIIKANNNEYIFNIKNVDSSSGSEYIITYNNNEIDQTNFKRLYQVLISTKADELATKITNQTPLLEYTFKFYGRTPDLNVKFYQTTARKAAANINGDTVFQVSMTYIDKVIKDIDNLFNGININVDWS